MENSFTPIQNKAQEQPEREFRSRGAGRTARGRPSLPSIPQTTNGESAHINNGIVQPNHAPVPGRGRGRGHGQDGMTRGGPPPLQRRSTISGGGPPMNLVTGDVTPPNRQLPQTPTNLPPQPPNRQLPQAPGGVSERKQLPQPPSGGGDRPPLPNRPLPSPGEQPSNRQLPVPPGNDRKLPPTPGGKQLPPTTPAGGPGTGRPPGLPARPQSVRARSATTSELPSNPPAFLVAARNDKPSRPPPPKPEDTPPANRPPRPPVKPTELTIPQQTIPHSQSKTEVAPSRNSFIMPKAASSASITRVQPEINDSLSLKFPQTAPPQPADFRPKSGSQSVRGPRPQPTLPQKPKEYEFQQNETPKITEQSSSFLFKREIPTKTEPSIPIRSQKDTEIPVAPPRSPENQRRKHAASNPPPLPWREEIEKTTVSSTVSEGADERELQKLNEKLSNLPNSFTLQKTQSIEDEFAQLTEKLNDVNEAISSTLQIRRGVDKLASNFPKQTSEMINQVEIKTKQYQIESEKLTKQLEAINKLLHAGVSASLPAATTIAAAPSVTKALNQPGHRNTISVGPGIRIREEYVKAKIDFTSANPLQLSYSVGTVILIIDRFPTGWIKGSLPNGTIGFFQEINTVPCDPNDPTSFFVSQPSTVSVPQPTNPTTPVVQQPTLPTIQRVPSVVTQITQPISQPVVQQQPTAQQRPLTNQPATLQPVHQPQTILPVQKQPVPNPVVRGQARPVSGVIERSRSNTVTALPVSTTPKYPQARALYDFNKVNATELELIKGEIVALIKPGDQWTFVSGLNGQGYVPTNYVQQL